MFDEVTEAAKAVQETAKTARSGIEATQALGRFVSRITTEPLETVMGILNDKLQFVRWERKLRLAERGGRYLISAVFKDLFEQFLINSLCQSLSMLPWKRMASYRICGRI